MKQVAEPLCQLLIHEAVAMVERSVDARLGHSTGSSSGAEAVITTCHAQLSAIGYDVGYRFIERTAQQRLLKIEPLEIIKFVCREFWMDVFGKHIDKLQTNHRGVFVLKDSSFQWIARLRSGRGEDSLEMLRAFLAFPCGLIRGALANLGFEASVAGEVDTSNAKQSASFHIRLAPTT